MVGHLGLIIDGSPRVISYASPIGSFPRSYDVVMPELSGLLNQLDSEGRQAFARAIHRLLRFLGPLPLDYEIHQAEGLPLHAHLNVRRFPYSNVAGTLNLPQGIWTTSTGCGARWPAVISSPTMSYEGNFRCAATAPAA